MKAITSLLLLTVCQFGFAGGDTNIVAMSDWSKPVGTKYGQTLRARMIIAQDHAPASRDTGLYLELQNISEAAGAPMLVYFDPDALRCEILDANGKPPPPTGGGGSGGGPVAGWITLPHDSTIRLRANMYGYGFPPNLGFQLTVRPGMFWVVKAGDTNDYFLSGKFSVTPPTNAVPKDFNTSRAAWSGTLELPKVKIAILKP